MRWLPRLVAALVIVRRRFAAGTLAEQGGALAPSVIDTDLDIRMHRMQPLAAANPDLGGRPSSDGPAQRMSAPVGAHGRIAVRWQRPGRTIFGGRSVHDRDLLDNDYLPEQHFDAPFASAAIATGESRWIF